jgi:hypothetical protein
LGRRCSDVTHGDDDRIEVLGGFLDESPELASGDRVSR